jgi:hypothetical protein
VRRRMVWLPVRGCTRTRTLPETTDKARRIGAGAPHARYAKIVKSFQCGTAPRDTGPILRQYGRCPSLKTLEINMPDHSDSPEDGIPTYVVDHLSREGVDLSNAETRRAVRATVAAMFVAQLEDINSITDQLKPIRWNNVLVVFFSAIGFVGALLTLAAGFKPFLDALRKLFSGSSTEGLSHFFSTALAQAAQTAPVSQTSVQLAPVLVYGVYILLAIAYVVSLFQVFMGREVKDKGNAMEMFKNLNSFFIGAISGKIV